MTLPEIDKILKQGEGLSIEFKSARGKVPASFYETVVSFSNTDGGTVLFGVKDEALVEGDGYALYQKQLSSFRINISGERLAIIMAKVIMVSIYAEDAVPTSPEEKDLFSRRAVILDWETGYNHSRRLVRKHWA